MTQPEALRLADLLEQIDGQYWQVQDSAAAELRRLYLVEQALDRCRVVCDATSEGWRADAERWRAQRDALLEALQDLCDEQEGPPLVRRHRQWQAAIDKARAAIKAAEENT